MIKSRVSLKTFCFSNNQMDEKKNYLHTWSSAATGRTWRSAEHVCRRVPCWQSSGSAGEDKHPWAICSRGTGFDILWWAFFCCYVFNRPYLMTRWTNARQRNDGPVWKRPTLYDGCLQSLKPTNPFQVSETSEAHEPHYKKTIEWNVSCCKWLLFLHLFILQNARATRRGL